LRILFVLPYLPSLIRVRPYQFVRELAREHEVSILATDSSRALEQAEDLQRWCRQVEVVPLSVATSVRSCLEALVRGDPLQAAVCQSPELDRRLMSMLREQFYDVVHVEHLRAARLLRLLPPGMPRLFDSVDSISLLLERTLRSSHSMRQRVVAAVELRRTRGFEARVLNWGDRSIVTSPDDATALRDLNRQARVDVVPNGVDLDYFSPLDRKPEPATLVFSGKMSYHANVTAVLHFVETTFPLIRATRPDIQLRIVGSNPSHAIQALARDPVISVTGQVPDIRSYVRNATVAICPVTVKVGIQNKVLEAMALGVPVVSSPLGAEGLQAVPGRDFLIGASPAEFAAAVCRVVAEPALAESLWRSARAFVERHHRWDTITRHLQDLYAEAIASRAHLETATGPRTL
jgi:sugar transferase (PEP-CTERM/EpsH1 system associated)